MDCVFKHVKLAQNEAEVPGVVSVVNQRNGTLFKPNTQETGFDPVSDSLFASVTVDAPMSGIAVLLKTDKE